MSQFYTLESGIALRNYMSIDMDSIDSEFRTACYNSEFQHICPDESKIIYLSKESDYYCADFMYDYSNCIPLVSDRLKNLFDDFDIDNIIYQRIILKHPLTRSEYEFWLALPSRIDCLDFEKSEFSQITGAVKKIVVSEKKTGRYKIFKMSGLNGRRSAGGEIIVTEKLKNYLEKTQQEKHFQLECVYFNKL